MVHDRDHGRVALGPFVRVWVRSLMPAGSRRDRSVLPLRSARCRRPVSVMQNTDSPHASP